MIGVTLDITEPTTQLVAALSLHAVVRLAYVFYIGLRLRSAERYRPRERDEQLARWHRFKRHAAFILNADAATTALVIATSLNTLAGHEELGWLRATGAVLVVIGIAIKVSAYRAIGEKGYYWYNFFCDQTERSYVRKGIYRYFDNPMYGPGYLHALGFPLLFLSFWGLASALFDWAMVWIFYMLFERPHTQRHARSRQRSDRPPLHQARAGRV